MINENYDAKYFIDHLEMLPHVEGGYYKECLASNETLTSLDRGERNLWTSIYFLLEEGDCSHLHRLQSDEVWYYHSGSSLTIYMISPDGQLITSELGLNIAKGEKPQIVVPKGYIFGSMQNEAGYSLVGCMVAPGFDFRDFELFTKEELMEIYPEHSEIICRLTR